MSTLIPEDRHRQILATCVDVPETPPTFPLPISEVGISGKTVWVRLAENKGGHLPFTVKILVNLDADRRGIHMSRIEQEISAMHDREFASLPEYGRLLGINILRTHNARHLSLELRGQLPHIQRTPVSRLSSIDSIEVSFKIVLQKNRAIATLRTEVGAAAFHLTTCPCTLSYNKVLFDRRNDPWPQATHSQRSRTELRVGLTAERKLPTFRDLTAILDTALHLSQDLLKRPDETELVLKAHKCPQFAEDSVREVARAAGRKFKDVMPPETRIQVHTLSLESIHIHDVECFLDTNLAEIMTVPEATGQE